MDPKIDLRGEKLMFSIKNGAKLSRSPMGLLFSSQSQKV